MKRPVSTRCGVAVLAMGFALAGAAASQQGKQAGAGGAVGGASRPAARAEWKTREVRAPGVTYHTFYSKLAGAEVSYHLFTPASVGGQKAGGVAGGLPVVYWLHGSGGGLGGIAPMAARFQAAIDAGHVPPFLAVFVNGMEEGMYVDWASADNAPASGEKAPASGGGAPASGGGASDSGDVPIESVIVRELVPEVDRRHPTIPVREARLLDGFSMGGYGAGRLGFKHVDVFGAVSMVGAGPLQEDLLDPPAPRAGRRRAAEILARVYGNDRARFLALSPRTHAAENAAEIARRTPVRLVVGRLDETFPANEAFHQHLTRLGIPHEWIVLPDIGHDPLAVRRAMGDADWEFYRRAFAVERRR